MSPYLGPSDGDKKRSRLQNQGKRKPLLTKMTTFKKSRKVRKRGQSEKGSEEGAAPASIAKENQSDGEDRGQPELRYHREVGHDDRDVRQDDPFARQSDPMAAVLGLPIHVLHAGE